MFAAVNGNVIQIYSVTSFENILNLKGHSGKVSQAGEGGKFGSNAQQMSLLQDRVRKESMVILVKPFCTSNRVIPKSCRTLQSPVLGAWH